MTWIAGSAHELQESDPTAEMEALAVDGMNSFAVDGMNSFAVDGMNSFAVDGMNSFARVAPLSSDRLRGHQTSFAASRLTLILMSLRPKDDPPQARSEG